MPPDARGPQPDAGQELAIIILVKENRDKTLGGGNDIQVIKKIRFWHQKRSL